MGRCNQQVARLRVNRLPSWIPQVCWYAPRLLSASILQPTRGYIMWTVMAMYLTCCLSGKKNLNRFLSVYCVLISLKLSNSFKRLSTLLIPRYFGPTLYTKGGRGGEGIWTPTTSSIFSSTNVKFCTVWEIPFKVLENKRLVKNLSYDYHGNCLITMVLLLIIVKMIMKNR